MGIANEDRGDPELVRFVEKLQEVVLHHSLTSGDVFSLLGEDAVRMEKIVLNVDDDDGGEVKTPAAPHHLGDTVDENNLFGEF